MGAGRSTARAEQLSLTNEDFRRNLVKQLQDLSHSQACSVNQDTSLAGSTSDMGRTDSMQGEELRHCRIRRATEGQVAESSKNLIMDTKARCGRLRRLHCDRVPCPIVNCMSAREMGLKRRSCCAQGNNGIPTAGFPKSERAEIMNRFVPNEPGVIESIRTKTFCVSHVGDGDRLITASQDHKIRLYHRTKAGFQLERIIHVPYVGWSILDMTVSPDGHDLVYSTWNDALYQCSLTDHTENWVPLRIDAQDNRFALFSIRFNADGTEIVSGSTDQHLYVYNREVGQSVLSVKAHNDDVNAVCFADSSSNIILSGADDGLVKVWDRRTMGVMGSTTPVGVMAGHLDGITYIDSRRDDRYFLSNSKDQSVKVWDLRCTASETAKEATIRSVMSQRWDYRYQGVPNEMRNVLPLEGDCSVMTLRGHSVLHTLIRAKFSPEDTGRRYIYTGCAAGNCYVYDIVDGRAKRVLKGHQSVVRDCSWDPHNNELVTTAWDGMTVRWTSENNGVPSSADPLLRKTKRRKVGVS